MFTNRGKENRSKVYEFIKSWTEKHAYPPSIREICAGVGIVSTKAVKYHIDALVNSGLVRRQARRARALETTSPPFGLPLLGRIAAGHPLLAVENIEETVTLSRFRGCFLLRVKGDSMIGAGILDSDLVIVQPQSEARNGDVIVALLDNEATVKRFSLGDKVVTLRSENPNFAPISVDPGRADFKILGRVLGLLRDRQPSAPA